MVAIGLMTWASSTTANAAHSGVEGDPPYKWVQVRSPNRALGWRGGLKPDKGQAWQGAQSQPNRHERDRTDLGGHTSSTRNKTQNSKYERTEQQYENT